MNPIAATLLSLGFAPCALNRGGQPVGEYGKDQQPEFSAESDSYAVGVLTSCPPPRNASAPVQNWRGSWLATVTAKGVPADWTRDLDALVTGGMPVPVRVEGDTRQYIFRMAPGAHFSSSKSQSTDWPETRHHSISAEAAPGFVPLSGEWPAGTLLDMSVEDIPILDAAAAKAIAQEFTSFVYEHAPQKPEWKPAPPTPIVAPGERLKWGNLRARLTLEQGGYRLAPVTFGEHMQPPTWPMQCDDASIAECGVGLVLSSGLTMLSLDWSLPPENVEIYARMGAAARGAEVAAGIERIFLRHVGEGKLAVHRQDERVTFVFRTVGSFLSDYDIGREAKRSDGMSWPNSHVRIKTRSRGVSGAIRGEGWSLDFLETKRAELVALEPHTFNAALAEAGEWLAGGADLNVPVGTDDAQTEATAPARRGRKAAAAA
jgi:hypothetical protein